MQNNINFYDTSTVHNEVEPAISSISTRKITVDSEPQTHADNPNIMVDQTKQPYNYENFHLDPQDFQNFLLINPPLTEYSNYYYMNAYNNNSSNNNNNNGHSHSHNSHSFHNTSETQVQAQAQVNPASVADSSLPSEFNETLLDNIDPSGVTSTFEAQVSSTQFPQQSQLQRGQPNSFTSLQTAAMPIPQLTHNNSNSNGHNHHNTQQCQSLNFNALSSSLQPFPKRRLSISNGQIGQISMMVHQKDLENVENNNLNSSSQFRNANNNLDDDVDNENEIEVDDDEDENNAPIEVDKNGVPCRQLIYNNQVIFNPAGPIPGTASWKRQKILERNRIAASKCRQKKKNLQKKLQQDVEDLSKKNSRLESMLSHIKTRLTIYSEKAGVSVDEVLGINTSNGNNDLDTPTDHTSTLIKSETDDYIPIDKKASNRNFKNSKSGNDNAQFDDDVELERKLCEWMSGAEM